MNTQRHDKHELRKNADTNNHTPQVLTDAELTAVTGGGTPTLHTNEVKPTETIGVVGDQIIILIYSGVGSVTYELHKAYYRGTEMVNDALYRCTLCGDKIHQFESDRTYGYYRSLDIHAAGSHLCYGGDGEGLY
jgi:hypothetical protein